MSEKLAPDKRHSFIHNGQKVFEWDQTLEEANIYISLPQNVPTKQFYCNIQPKHLEVGIKGTSPYLNHDLTCPVKVDSSFWTLEDDVMHITLQKRDKGQTWPSPIYGQGELDPLSVDQEQRRLMLQRFQEENPGFDFSQAEFTDTLGLFGVTWKRDYRYLKDWGLLPLTDNFENWTKLQPRRPHTPVLICWVIWRTCNKIIFEQENSTMSQIIRWIIQLFSLYPGTSYKKLSRTHISPPLVGCMNVGTFDGVAHNGWCGGGGTLTFTGGQTFIYKIGLGMGTNSRAVLLSLWALIWLAKSKDCQDFQIFGDSKAIIDWINGKSTIRNSALMHWYQKICDLKSFFGEISFQHIYREYNSKADFLSKEALSLGDGIFMLKEDGDVDVQPWEQFSIY